MNRELEEKLALEFPFMRRGKSYETQKAEGRVSDLYGAWGCECSNGWYELLRGLCSDITAVYQKCGQPVDIVVDQVKEKWGTLRFYYHFEGCPHVLHALDFIGSGSIRFEQSATDLQREIATIVRKWEETSGTVCEYCGKPGSLRKDRRVSTLCDTCWDLRNKRRAETAKGVANKEES